MGFCRRVNRQLLDERVIGKNKFLKKVHAKNAKGYSGNLSFIVKTYGHVAIKENLEDKYRAFAFLMKQYLIEDYTFTAQVAVKSNHNRSKTGSILVNISKND